MHSPGHLPDSPVTLAALLPHAPVLVEPVGGRRAREASATIAAMQVVARRLFDSAPEAVVVTSPHSPRKRGAFGFWNDGQLEGSFERFNAPEAVVRVPNARELTREIEAQVRARNLTTWNIPPQPLDHGALVPLWFLAAAGWAGPTVVISLNYPHEGGLSELGESIAQAARERGQHIAVVASGDMSHALQPGAPSGFHPRARDFDREFIELVRAGRFREIEQLDPELQELAAEDVVDSTLIAAASARWRTEGHEVLSYEAPFGVGYGVAVLWDAAKSRGATQAGELPRIARDSVESALRNGSAGPPPAVEGFLAQRKGVFVTIRQRNGELRGCVGTLTPKCRDVAEETWRMAREAAFDDARFSPVERRELPELRFEVSVIHDLEPADSLADLDPARYGVLITTPDGRRAALLPGIAEITTVDEQLRIARRKGHIGEEESIRIQRFQADHFEEQD